ncbi:hypothetical protein SADUNF_Sadunf16G0086900 [Salix dunnii]|uniref:Uncharacterized protein n=1 Tax=Salix dunnii TaxID=1413687 RepID=A0A835J7R1_9ROSI|nr:hypothetical protein SADUNF_Sadunf16G0086900 [Salix dunnii]
MEEEATVVGGVSGEHSLELSLWGKIGLALQIEGDCLRQVPPRPLYKCIAMELYESVTCGTLWASK